MLCRVDCHDRAQGFVAGLGALISHYYYYYVFVVSLSSCSDCSEEQRVTQVLLAACGRAESGPTAHRSAVSGPSILQTEHPPLLMDLIQVHAFTNDRKHLLSCSQVFALIPQCSLRKSVGFRKKHRMV